VKPQPPPSLLLGLEPVQSCLEVVRVMSEQKVPTKAHSPINSQHAFMFVDAASETESILKYFKVSMFIFLLS